MRPAERAVAVLAQRNLTLATCESLTGGAIAADLTSVPGASAVFRGALVTYATDLKAGLAGVDPEALRRDGAVSAPTALAMARGARRACAADWAIACTGVAGPAELEGHAPGTVWIAVCGPEGKSDAGPSLTRLCLFPGGRDSVRTQTVAACLTLLLEALGW